MNGMVTSRAWLNRSAQKPVRPAHVVDVDFADSGMRAMRPNALVSVRDSAHNQTDDDSNSA